MDTPQTCGRGLAEHSPLPIKLAELTDSVRAILELHMRALDLTDPASTKEFEAYRRLANEHRDAAAHLHAIGTEMAGYRDLPMGRHDLTALTTPANTAAFETFVNIQREVVALLENRLGQDAKMLAAMRDTGT
ncbi:MAG TPA: hypothetical protein VJ802_07505 [Gemmatimonadaceae bacterium]|nr:hypothetical protein [Gemmatimonadaceae bacterium]